MYRPATSSFSKVFASGIARRNAGSFAKFSVLGRVGGEPVAAQTASGKDFVRYSVATNPIKDGPPSWFNISVFEPRQVELTQNLIKKGSLVHVAGNVSTGKFEKADGSTGFSTNFYQQSFDLISSPYNANTTEGGEGEQQ